MFVSVLLCTDTQVMNVSSRGLSLGGIPEGYSDCTLGGIRGKQVFSMVRSWTLVRDAIRSTPGASPPHLSGRDECDACVNKGQTKSDQEGKVLV